MNVATLLDILKYILPALVVLAATWLIVNKFLTTEIERKQLALFSVKSDEVLRLKLQAYERLALFLERLHPQSLISRFYNKQLSAREVHLNMIQAVREEFEHNMSQQIYVSRQVWETIKSAKEQEASMINRIASTLPIDAGATELVQKMSEFVLTAEYQLPAQIALEILNDEAKNMMLIP